MEDDSLFPPSQIQNYSYYVESFSTWSFLHELLSNFYWSVLMYAAISFANIDNQIIKLKKKLFDADGWD